MMIYGVVIVGIVVLWAGIWFYRHQKLLEERAFLLREAVRNRDFAHRLPVKGLFFGERALQRTVNDLSEDISRLLAQNEVESWQRLTRVLTHEIMNATAPISSISQAYLNHPKIKGSFYEEGIRAIYETSCGLSAFVDSYRKLTSLQEPNLEEVVLCPFVESIRVLYPDLEWHLNIDPYVILSLDENMWRQVLINLVKNALEAGATKMDIRWRDGLYVSNNGMPIPADVACEIFVPFFTTKKTGSGIGLSLSRQLMVRQGYMLTLAERPVSGYTVTFMIR